MTAPRPDAGRHDVVGRMLRAVRGRLAWAAFGRALLWSGAVACGAVLLLAPLAWWRPGLIPALVTWAVPAAGVLALALAVTFRGRPTLTDAALVADRFAGSKDLFLTAAELRADAENPAFAPLVAADAAAKAPAVRPAEAVPFAVDSRSLWPAGLAAAALVAGLFLVPRVDPFGTVAAAEEAVRETEQTAANAEAAQKRVAELKTSKPEADLSPAVSAAVERLKQDLRRTTKAKVPENRRKLSERQSDLGQLWRRISAEKMRELLSEDGDRRALGGSETGEQARQWKEDLKNGNAKSLREEIRKLAAEAAEAAAETDPEKRAEQMKALREKARAMENFARREAGNESLAEAMKQAGAMLQQAAEQARSEATGESGAGDRHEQMKQAAKAAEAMLQQAELESEALAQAARDLQTIEKAMRAAQAAKQANELGQLDGQEATDAESLEEFLAVYEEILQEAGAEATEAREGSVAGSGEGDGEGDGEDGDGEGEGAGGTGRGEREEFAEGAMTEDPSSKTGFKTELSKSHLVAGKTLMSLKTKGESDRGERTTEYEAAVGQLNEGVDEAILAEDVPPGYHDRIKGYFDSLRPDPAAGGGD